MKKIYADLHLHSTASDGILSPEDLMKAARSKGLSVVGLTDHDTVEGNSEAFQAALKLGMEFVHGVELSCGWPGHEVPLHVLGLFIDSESAELRDFLKRQQRTRYTRALQMLDRLEDLNINVSPLRTEFEGNTDKVLGRPHVARFLVESGVVKEFQDAFDHYLRRGAPAFVPKIQVLPEEGIEIIHGAGGLAFIAHPGLAPDWNDLWERVRELPWDGLEVYYSEHYSGQETFFFEFSQERGLLMTGGSDYHGECGKHVNRLGKFGLEEKAYFRFNRNRLARMKERKVVSPQKLGENQKALEGAKRPTAGDEPREFFATDGIMSRSPGWARATTSPGEGGRVPPFIEKSRKV